jgi:hypothetical protein
MLALITIILHRITQGASKMSKTQLVALMIATTVLLSPLIAFGKEPKKTKSQFSIFDQNIQVIESSEPSKKDQEKNILELKISPNKSTYRVGEPIEIKMTLKNISQDPEIRAWECYSKIPMDYGFRVLDPQNKKAPYRRSRLDFLPACISRGRNFLLPDDMPMTRYITINEFVVMHTLGVYSIAMWTEAYKDEGNQDKVYLIKSNSIEVHVISK